jgi:alpha-glucosidase (family GH31 glycosyl hydrolase)
LETSSHKQYIPEHFKLEFAPVAAEDAVVIVGHARFTVLTSRLIRMEYSPTDQFEDHASQAFWYRQQPVPDFEVKHSEEEVEIITRHLHLRYAIQEQGFTPETLQVTLQELDETWRYGDPDVANLGGTRRTLDGADGAIPLEPGLMSQAGWVVVDDSQTLIFNDASWLEQRQHPDNLDLYFFGYGHDYRSELEDYSTVTGAAPLIPRWVLGNWWSRYWAYTQEELKALMTEFREHEVPLSVCIVDMDWHLTKTGNASSGWTGYTWNRELFPDPEGFIDWLHGQGLKTALNLHPASGVYPHEEVYPVIAEALGVDPDSEAPVPFAIADPKFAQAYFELLHHPLEAQGIDFWWVDWQQGSRSGLEGLDPLWWLNHLHFYDLGRDGTTRPFIFSRWGGLGNHRYPIGFSGDSVVSWDSLAFQPYFTSTAANVGYGWWSHDIGGHMGGVEDPELYTRWIQFGVFSPIMRLHSTKNPYHERRPWGYNTEVLQITRDMLQLRHALIPYIYTMAWRNTQEHRPLVQPMYHEHPEEEAAYYCPQQYYFGSELIVAPFTAPRDPDTGLSRQVVWLPEGDWFLGNGFLTSLPSGETEGENSKNVTGRWSHYTGGRWHTLYGALDEIPVLAKAGAIVPLGPKAAWGGIENPDHLTVHIFPGADNTFKLYEDDGETTAYQEGHYALTTFSQAWAVDRLEFDITSVEGNPQVTPQARTYTLVFHSITQPDQVQIHRNDSPITPGLRYDGDAETLIVRDIELPADTALHIVLTTPGIPLISRHDATLETCHKLLRAFKLNTHVKHMIHTQLPHLAEDITQLAAVRDALRPTQMQALIETLRGVGVARFDYMGAQDSLIARLKTHIEAAMHDRLPAIAEDAARFGVQVPPEQLEGLVEIIAEDGTRRLGQDSGKDIIVMWNNQAKEGVSSTEAKPSPGGMCYTLGGYNFRPRTVIAESEPVPAFKAIATGKLFSAGPWTLRVNYFDLLSLDFSSET